MKNNYNWYEDDNFWDVLSPFFFGESRISATPTEVEFMIELLRLQPSAHILDMCCGPGRHSLELARRGYRLTGVDRTEAYVGKARSLALAENLEIEFIQSDIRDYVNPGTFDCIINMFTSFGYFEDQDEDRRVLNNFHQSLKEGGVLLIDIMGKEVLARIFQERGWQEVDGVVLLEEREVCDNWGWCDNRWTVFRDGKKHEFRIAHRLYSAVELSTLLKDAGFDRVDVYGSLSATPYDQNAKRLVAVTYK